MRKATIAGQCEWFERGVDELEALVGQLLPGAAPLRARRWIAKMAAVEAWSLFSQFAEWVLYCSINQDSTRLRETTGLSGLPQHLNLDTIIALFTMERGYFDFSSYGQLVDLSRKYVSEEDAGNPFKKPDVVDAQLVDRLARIRNRIVHDSRKSRKSYESLMKNDYGYDRVQSPETFLLSQGDGKTRLSELLDALRQVSVAIRS